MFGFSRNPQIRVFFSLWGGVEVEFILVSILHLYELS